MTTTDQTGAFTGEDCERIAFILRDAADQLSLIPGARGIRAVLTHRAREYTRTATLFARAARHELDPQIVAVGALERGELVMLGNGTAEFRRSTPTGAEFVLDGMPQWENISGTSAPFVVVSEGIDRNAE